MALYQEVWDPQRQAVSTDVIVMRGDQPMYIPNNPQNTDWQAYQAWLKAGNEPDPPDNVPQG